MANRQETNQRRKHLIEDLRAACRDGRLAPGDLLPSQNELSQTYQLSATVVYQEVSKLIEEGLFYAVPRVGTFVGMPRSAEVEVYLLILPWHCELKTYTSQIHTGFEERITQLGGVSYMLTHDVANELLSKGELPDFKGVFEIDISAAGQWFQAQSVPTVSFGDRDEKTATIDLIHFDDADGGAQATRHLLAIGHRRIAFLGFHSHENEAGIWKWSAAREAGWRRAMLEAGLSPDLTFRPPQKFDPVGENTGPEQFKCAREIARSLVTRSDIDAVVAVNSIAAHGLLEELKDAGVPSQQWPALIAFDDEPQVSGAIVSYMRLPWEQIGRGAAGILHGRVQGKIQGAPIENAVPMRLIPRLSCRDQWTSMPGFGAHFNSTATIKHPSSSVISGQLIEA